MFEPTQETAMPGFRTRRVMIVVFALSVVAVEAVRGSRSPRLGQVRAVTVVPTQAPPLVIVHANVIDMASGAVTRDATIQIDGKFITRISAGTAAPPGARVIDAQGRWAVPGLIDAHTHIASLDAARRALESGVTTVRSASTPLYQDIAIREAVRSGVIAGPDMQAAGVFVTPDLGETVLADTRLGALFASGVRTPEQLRALVRVNLDRGVDVIKTRGTERAGLPNTDPRKQVYDEAQLRAVVEEAATRNIPVEAHAHGDEGAYAAVAAGVRSIEHGTYVSDSTLRLMKAKGTFLVPTLSTLADLVEPGGDYDDPILQLRGKHMFPRAEDAIRRAHAMGVSVVTGGDTQYGPNSVTRISHEIARFVGLGFTPLEALQSATTVAAQLLRIEKTVGRIAVGFEADVILVERNPLEDVRALQDVLVVISNGQLAVSRIPFGLRKWRMPARAPIGVRRRWTMPAHPTVVTTPFARLDAIGPETWALVSTPLGGDRTAFANSGIIAGRAGVIAVEGFYRTGVVPAALGEWMAGTPAIERAMNAWYRQFPAP